MSLLLSCVVFSFLLTYIFSIILLKYCRFSFFLDIPDQHRKHHYESVPRFGGLAFSVVMMGMMMYLFGFAGKYVAFFLGVLAVIVVGIYDDVYGLSWNKKLCVQWVMGTGVFYVFFKTITVFQFFFIDISLAPLMAYVVFMVWFLGIMNSVNLLDGLDGLAGGVMALIFLGLAYLGFFQHNIVFVAYCLIIVGGVCAFLLFNKKPAKFFMGDTGSLFLGYNLACSPLLFHVSQPALGILDITPFICLSLYLIMDTNRVFLVRFLQNRHPFKPDRTHLHFMIVDLLGSYSLSIRIIYGYVFSCCAVLMLYLHFTSPVAKGIQSLLMISSLIVGFYFPTLLRLYVGKHISVERSL